MIARRWIALFAFALSLLVAQGASASTAGLVIRHGDGSTTYAIVVFPEKQISSMELLNRSTISLSTVQFGSLGDAVCTLDGEGCGASACRKTLCQTGAADSPFWQFFRQNGSGEWSSQPLGASGSTVQDGVVDGWSWTSGDSGLVPIDVPAIAAKLGVDLSSVSDSSTEAFTGSFDAEGNPLVRGGGSRVSALQTAAGIAALVVLLIAGVLLKRRAAS